jgi:hypothetical protein
VVDGNLTNNNAAPAANNVGALTALAEGTLNASLYTTGNLVLPVVDLAGNTNVDVQYWSGVVLTADPSTYGTAPTGTVIGVNSYITNTPAINLTEIDGNAASTAASGILKVGVVGNTGATLDAAPGSAAPTNAIQVGGTDGTDIRALSMTAKGTQGAYGVAVQELKDSGRNISNFFMAVQVVSTATETLQSLTGYKSGAAVAATTTPAVVTAGKTYRLQKIAITYISITTAGSIQVNLRANLSGVVAVTSPLVESWLVGANSVTAGTAETIVIDIPDGMEFAAGTGLGITVQGFGATGTAAAVGYAKVSMTGYEY